jgi:ATP-dependent Clp protease ATP-binding subunit ClpA
MITCDWSSDVCSSDLNVVLIMTTNAGAREMSDAGIGFQRASSDAGGTTSNRGRARGAIERTFTPEFRNRLDAWIAFDSLGFETIERVVDKFIDELRAQLLEQNVRVELRETARAWLARHGFDPQYGARPMARLIQTKIRAPLAEELLFGKLQQGGTLRLDAPEGELALEFLSAGDEVF